jgi:hypothetical protein
MHGSILHCPSIRKFFHGLNTPWGHPAALISCALALANLQPSIEACIARANQAWPGAPAQILVAGCGTAQQAIECALRFAPADVLAVDLSMSSLTYAKRKPRCFLQNVSVLDSKAPAGLKILLNERCNFTCALNCKTRGQGSFALRATAPLTHAILGPMWFNFLSLVYYLAWMMFR